MRNIITKIITTIMAVTMAFTFTACGAGNSGSGTTTEIRIMSKGGGYGRTWIDAAAARFAELKKNESYEEGKTGVTFKIDSQLDTGVSTMASSGYSIYFATTEAGSVSSLVAKGNLLDINDIVTAKTAMPDGSTESVEDRILPEYRNSFKASDGHYYAVPHFSDYPAISYDIERFIEGGFYLADPSDANTNKELYTAGDIGSAYFIKPGTNTGKSCGNDGVFGTEDDGLPTSVIEFLVMCARMEDKGVIPMTISGQLISYLVYFEEALWASLGGKKEIDTLFDYDGTMEVVKVDADENIIYTDEPIFNFFPSIKKPETEVITITNSNGYRVNDSYARYVAFAITEIMESYGWFSGDSSNENISHTMAQKRFITNGYGNVPKMAMFIEGSYWYNEAKDHNAFRDYTIVSGKADKQLGFMVMPTAIYDSVTDETNARGNTIFSTGIGKAFINANISGNEGLVRACKDFLQFCYTSEEIINQFSVSGAYRLGLDYNKIGLNDSAVQGLSDWQKSFYNVLKIADMVGARREFELEVFYPTLQGKKYTSILTAMRANANIKAKDCFDASRIRSKKWGGDMVI